MEELTELGQAQKGSIHCLSMIGQIEGHQILPDDVKTTKYEHVLPSIAAIEEAPEITGLLILLNTAGGDVEAGLAIAEMIAGMRKPTASLVLGGGHSIGVPLAVSADRSFIAPTASMTVHPVRITGVVIGAAQTYDYSRKHALQALCRIPPSLQTTWAASSQAGRPWERDSSTAWALSRMRFVICMNAPGKNNPCDVMCFHL